VTVLVNGGTIAWQDVAASVDAGRAVIVADGSGRTADLLAAATRDEASDARATALVQSGAVRAIDAADPQALASVAAELLVGGR
jgi:SLOG in TRPM, prokaryote